MTLKASTRTPTKATPIEDKFAEQLMDAGFAGRYRRNARFIEGRKFEGDFVFPKLRLVVEVDGGAFLGTRGGHTSGTGFTRDRERDSLAYISGWVTLRYTSAQVKDGSAIDWFVRSVERRQQEIGCEA